MGCLSNSCLSALSTSTVQRPSCRAYSISSPVTSPVGSWSSSFLCLVLSSSQALLSENDLLNSAHASVRKSKKCVLPLLFHSSGFHGGASLMNAFLPSIGVMRMRG